jgi:hypothetical protein
MKKLLFPALLLIAGCTQPDKARGLLEANGYRDIEITGYSLFSCSEDDTFATGFKATGPTGKRLKGTVCAGLFFKGATIRFD